jgi:anaerobic ribonucleoside-triphosphate reductase activating protein
MLKVIDIIPDTIVDGPRMRTSIYLSGCFHGCKGCHNPSSWKLENGKDTEFSVLIDKIREYGHKRLTISGGDGLCYQYKELLEFLEVLKKEIPDINIWLYTGYTFEEIIIDKDRKHILNYIDVLVDGKFVEDLKSKDCLYRGSTNQRLIKVSDSLNSGQVVLYS